MNTWVSIVVLIVAVLAVGLLRERWRVSRIEEWARVRGFARRFPVPPEGPQPAAVLVAALTVHGARLWGMVLEGTLDGIPVTIAEHESSEPGKKSGTWFTVVTWPIEGGGRIVMHRGEGSRAVAHAATAVGHLVKEPLAQALGMPARDEAPHMGTPGGWTVYGEPIERDRWLTPDKGRELDAWGHGGAFARDGGFGAWRVRGPISADMLATLPERFSAARRLLEHA